MKVAEALMQRKDTKTRMEALKKRLYQNAKMEEGGSPAEDPHELLEELQREVRTFEDLVARIDRTNAVARLEDGATLAAALIQRDMLRYMHLVRENLADHALPSTGRYSQREIRHVSAIDVSATRREADHAARACRVLDARIQRLNWETELVPSERVGEV